MIERERGADRLSERVIEDAAALSDRSQPDTVRLTADNDDARHERAMASFKRVSRKHRAVFAVLAK